MGTRRRPRNRGRPKARGAPDGVALAVHASDNRKTGRVNVTYVAQGSCPVTCPLMGAGCYGEGGHAGETTRRLNAAGPGLTPLEYARAEAREVDNLKADRDLRPHIVGDCRTPGAARVLGGAIDRYVTRSLAYLEDGADVWLYTHAWRLVPRDAWGESASVLASCETAGDVAAAHARGYATALVVPAFLRPTLHTTDEGVRLLPCPNQTRGVQCVDCRLCMGDTRLLADGITIGFAAHGQRRASVVRALEVINGDGK